MHPITVTQLANATLDDPAARSCVRSAANQAGSTCPVVAVPGSARPRVEGEPGLYRRRTVSTIRIKVGADWVRRHCPVPYAQACADRVDAAVERFES